MPSERLDSRAAAVALGLVLEAATVEVAEALGRDGVRAIVLKGPAVARWLYEDDPARTYVDVDLLVAPDLLRAAGATLGRLRFRRVHGSAHAEVWARRADSVVVDLHSSLVGVAPSASAWEILEAATEPMALGAATVEVLDRPARALHVALHAAQHGYGDERTLADLERALDRAAPTEWDRAAELAARLGAESAFATGLRLLPLGREEAMRLGLPESRSIETAVRAEGAPAGVLGLYRFLKTPGVRARARLLADEVFPAPAFLRGVSPLARRGRLGLAAAYVWRPFWLVSRLWPAVRTWWRVRRSSG